MPHLLWGLSEGLRLFLLQVFIPLAFDYMPNFINATRVADVEDIE